MRKKGSENGGRNSRCIVTKEKHQKTIMHFVRQSVRVTVVSQGNFSQHSQEKMGHHIGG